MIKNYYLCADVNFYNTKSLTKMKKIQSLILMLVLASAVFSCKKTDPSVDPKVAIIGKWRVTSSSFVFAGVNVDLLAQALACEKDNTIEFRNPNITIEDEGATKCFTSDPQQIGTGTWSLNSTNTVITIDGDANTIVEITNSVLRTKVKDVDLGLEVNTTYTKI